VYWYIDGARYSLSSNYSQFYLNITYCQQILIVIEQIVINYVTDGILLIKITKITKTTTYFEQSLSLNFKYPSA